MATRSTIAVQNDDGTINQIYCHWDGYLSNNGKLLKNHYNTIAKVKRLVKLGAISSLGEKCTKPKGQNNNDVYTVAYHRDRGDDFIMNSYDDFEGYMNGQFEEFNYFFKDGKWHVVGEDTLVELTDEMIAKED